MTTKIQKWGNSQGLRLPKIILKEAHIAVNDEVKISIIDGKIVIEPLSIVRNKYKIKELVSRMPHQYKVEEVDWGGPTGREEW